MKPIVLTTAEAQEILCGDRTILRRKAKFPDSYCPHRYEGMYKDGLHLFTRYRQKDNLLLYVDDRELKAPCKIGDILWAREAWCPTATIESWYLNKKLFAYKADYADKPTPWRWRPPINMPREATRLFLKVALVGAELAPGRDRAEWVWVIDFNRVNEGDVG